MQKHIVITEIIHHGDYRNKRHVAVPNLSAETVKAVTDMSPYGGIHNANQQERVCQELASAGYSQIGWSNYGVRCYSIGQECEYYLFCDNPAEGVTSHPTMHAVPTCQRCADKHEVDLVKFLPTKAPAATVNIEARFTLIREENGDVKKVDILDILVDGPDMDHVWQVIEREKSCEHESINEDCADCNTIDFPAAPFGTGPATDILYYLLTEEKWTEQDKDVKYVF